MKPIRKPDPAVKRMAAKGRHGDNAAVHVTKGEMLIPPQVMANDPLLRHRAMMAFAQLGKDPNEFVVGHPKAKRNPRTGAEEFALEYVIGSGWQNTPDAGQQSQDSTVWQDQGGDPYAPQGARMAAANGEKTFEQKYGTERTQTQPWQSGPLAMIDPNIPGGPDAYMKDGEMLPDGAWPEAFRNPTSGISTYWSAPPPDYTRENGTLGWSASDRLGVLPWDPRAGGTGDPYVPWSEDWAKSPAGQEVAALMYSNGMGAGSAGDAYRAAGMDPAKAHQNMQSSASLNAPEKMSNGYYRYSDGTIVDHEGWVLKPTTIAGQPGYFDTYYGVYRTQNGTIVSANGQPIVTQYNQHIGPSSDYLKVYGSQQLNALGLPPRDSPPNGEGGPQPFSVGPFGGGAAATGARTSSANPNASPFAPNTGGAPGAPQQPGGGVPNPTGAPQTGSGLPAGQANPYSYPSYPGLNLNFYNGQQPTTGTGTTTPTTNQQGYYGLQMTPGGYPYWGGYSPQPTDPNATQEQGGISGYTPNSQTVDFRPAFSY